MATTTDSLGVATIPQFEFEEFDPATTFEDQLLDFDLPGAITSLNSFSYLEFAPANDEKENALHKTTIPAKASSLAWTSLTPVAESRISYAIDQLKLAPRMMVNSGSTLWSHVALYDEYMPRILQDAYAACALYSSRNEANADLVDRHITNRIDELMAAPLPSAQLEIVARAHALMLYQIMFVFGDIRSRNQAQDLILHLEQAGQSLHHLSSQQTNPIGSKLPVYPSTAARAAWKTFQFQETVRRTTLSLFQFLALCHLLCGRNESCAPSLARGNEVTLSAHLWNAKSAFDFAVAWNEKSHFLVKDLDFSEVMRDAEPDDVDDFAKMMLVGLMGIDDVRGWFYMKGGTF